MPHPQAPAAEHPSAAIASQVPQAAPTGAHAVAERGATQVVPAQQPSGHVAAVHAVGTQAPPTQRASARHACPLPHAQLPVASHPSARAASHARHADPNPPHSANDGATHAPPRQHPVAQVVASHALPRQTPLAQCWPAPHAGPTPQRHSPDAAQALAEVGSHARQLSPAVPQVERLRGWQRPLEQQPSGQLDASQTTVPASSAGTPGVSETQSRFTTSQRDSAGHCTSEVQRA